MGKKIERTFVYESPLVWHRLSMGRGIGALLRMTGKYKFERTNAYRSVLGASAACVIAAVGSSACGSDGDLTDSTNPPNDAGTQSTQRTGSGKADAAADAPPRSSFLKGPDCDGLRPFNINGKTPDQIKTSDLTKGVHSTYLQAEASHAWDQLVSDAVLAGLDAKQLFATGWGSRPASNQSVHPMGLAVDVNWLADPARSEKFRTVTGEPLPISDAFFTKVFEWLYANSWKYGWCTTRNNRPLYLHGTATGGKRADGSFYGLEAWHFEYIPAAGTDPNRMRSPSKGDLSGPLGVPD